MIGKNFKTLIQAGELHQRWVEERSSDWVVIDCRFSLMEPDLGYLQYCEGHVPGAVYADLNKDLADQITHLTGRHPLPQQADFLSLLNRWGVKQNSQVIIYDDAKCAMATRLWWMLRRIGHQGVAVLDGGYSQWTQCNYPVDSDIPLMLSSNDQYAVGKSCLKTTSEISSDEVNLNLLEKKFILIDARSSERFKGISEPIDKKSGHIPGAINMPFEGNLDETGCFLSAGQLRKRFLAEMSETEAQNSVHMCGSGVTACHNIMAMEIAGLGGSDLYAGSWSEWIQDDQRPIVGKD